MSDLVKGHVLGKSLRSGLGKSLRSGLGKSLVVSGLAFILSIGAASESKAADINEFISCSGFESLTVYEKESFKSSIENLNPRVVEIFNKVGGTLEFVDNIEGFKLAYTDNLDDCHGIYYNDRILIKPVRGGGLSGAVRITPIVSNEKLLPHELGHMLFKRVQYDWNELDQQVRRKLIEEHKELYRIYGDSCYNLDEAFAVNYSLYVTGNATERQTEIAQYVESVILGRYDEYLEKGGNGPF